MIFFDKVLNMNIQHYIVKYIKLRKKQLGIFSFLIIVLIAYVSSSHVLRHVIQPLPPRAIAAPISISDTDIDDSDKTISVLVTDGANKNSQKNSTVATVMPTLPVVRELISYVPTMKNVATRGHLIGIPYLGDKFDAEDQRLINSISIEPSKQHKLIRSIVSLFNFLLN